MIFPSITTLIFGVVVIALLSVVDWYVWRITPVRRYPLLPERMRITDQNTHVLKEVA